MSVMGGFAPAAEEKPCVGVPGTGVVGGSSGSVIRPPDHATEPHPQVEHTVTEEVTGVDICSCMIRLA